MKEIKLIFGYKIKSKDNNIFLNMQKQLTIIANNYQIVINNSLFSRSLKITQVIDLQQKKLKKIGIAT